MISAAPPPPSHLLKNKEKIHFVYYFLIGERAKYHLKNLKRGYCNFPKIESMKTKMKYLKEYKNEFEKLRTKNANIAHTQNVNSVYTNRSLSK